ncbi:hypothetical protein GIB67_016422, partial [Kingdonia uniflora]
IGTRVPGKTYAAIASSNPPLAETITIHLQLAEVECSNTLVMKFPVGRPSVDDIQNQIKAAWGLSKIPVIGHLNCKYCFVVLFGTYRVHQKGGETSTNIIASIFAWSRGLAHRGPWGALSPVPENNAIVVDYQGGSLYAVVGDSYAYCWDVETGQIKTVFKGHSDYLHCVVARNSRNQVYKLIQISINT